MHIHQWWKLLPRTMESVVTKLKQLRVKTQVNSMLVAGRNV